MRAIVAGVCLAAACAGPDDSVPAPAQAAAQVVPADSLVLSAPGGVEIWFTGGRPARDSSGAECLERGLEIRGPAGNRGVPLLYTLEAPAVLDDSSISARVYTGCRPGARYRVSLRTGRPTPLGGP